MKQKQTKNQQSQKFCFLFFFQTSNIDKPLVKLKEERESKFTVSDLKKVISLQIQQIYICLLFLHVILITKVYIYFLNILQGVLIMQTTQLVFTQCVSLCSFVGFFFFFAIICLFTRNMVFFSIIFQLNLRIILNHK